MFENEVLREVDVGSGEFRRNFVSCTGHLLLLGQWNVGGCNGIGM
jgi:hypothetical protein